MMQDVGGSVSGASPDDRPDSADRPSPRLSVLIPSWNAALTIERALSSVLVERAVPLECVVVDDGSTDGTADVVRVIAERDPRVVLIRLPTNEGVSNARNRGLDVMRGEWFTGLDADDRFLPGGVAALMRPTQDPAVRAVIAQRIWTDGERTWISPLYDNPDIREPGRKSIATHPGLLYYVSTTGKALHRSLLTGLRFEGRVLGDQPPTVRALIRAGDGIEVIPDVVYEWTRPHPDHYVNTITAAKQASAANAIDMVVVARSALREVSEEADASYDDDGTRLRVTRAYFDRLVRSDIGGPVNAAIERHDPDTARLFEEVGRFLASVPTDVMASSDLLVRRILRPPVNHWRSLVPAARPAYWTMARPALEADPGLVSRIGGRTRAPAFVAARTLGAPLGTGLASAMLWVADGVRHVLKRLRPA
jgi:glycosyltransferase involved in cell wall biosynthesis